ncbi:MAG: radical SAM protein [Sulfolobales archaeon]
MLKSPELEDSSRSPGIPATRILPAPGSYDEATKTVKIAGRSIRVGGPLPRIDPENEKIVRVTQSICPYCQRLLPAIIYEKGEKIYIRKTCPEHGTIDELYFGDSKLYYRFLSMAREGRGSRYAYVELSAPCPYNCGLCPMHKSHSALTNLVVTNRCDLDCWYCFFFAERSGFVYEPTLDQIKYMVSQLMKQGVPIVIQITGGEPTLREDLPEIIKLLREMGITHLQLNTHGIKFARLYWEDPEKAVAYAKTLRENGVNTIYMSFDGVTPNTNPKNHFEVPFTFEVFRKAGMTSVVLVPVLIRTVNDHEVGDIIRFAAMNMDIVRSVNFQPVSLTGMMKRFEREKYRITIADAIMRIEEQTDGEIDRNQWYPIPACIPISEFIEALSKSFKFELTTHPHCGAGTYVYVDRRGSSNPYDFRFIPLGKMIDIEGFLEYLRDKSEDLKSGGSRAVVGAKILLSMITRYIEWKHVPGDLKKLLPKLLLDIFTKQSYEALGEFHYKFLFLGMMHFMDQYNYDVQRVMRCDIHYTSPDGRIIPFCAFNVLPDLYRDHVMKKYSMSFEEYEKLYGPGRVGEKVKYRRSRELIEKIRNSEIYRKHYEYFLKKHRV